ncbi:MAG: PD-(D/E)XK nuclease family protein [Bacteroidaceae bacterium]|nr:PD-(D/E)XK nuclease family protein [Bacteroidaceae bacterium]
MSPFLQAVAHDVYRRYGDNLSRTAVIFPGKRAGLWFDRYLYECAGHPLWSPAYVSVDELFDSLSSLEKESPIRTICLLYEIFCRFTGSTESLDDFYHWGELMLSDFDDIDKNCVEADRLFVNLADIKDVESRFDYLNAEQRELLARFFAGLSSSTERTELKRRFIELWQAMGNIYKGLHTTLSVKGLAYEGMMYRDAIEHFDASLLTYDHYVIVGFNVLNRVEQALFDRLKESGKALFYWDYDRYYYDNPHHEAGTFVRENIARYGNALDGDDTLYDHLAHLPEITYISAPTDNAQARYLHTWLDTHLTDREEETAIVLCNEDIAPTVLHALPGDRLRNVNVTMGAKLTQTSVYTLVSVYLDLHTKGYDEAQDMYMIDRVDALLSHPYIVRLYPDAESLRHRLTDSKRIYIPSGTAGIVEAGMEHLFAHPADNRSLLSSIAMLISHTGRLFSGAGKEDYFTQLGEEALFQVHRVVESFKTLVEEGTLHIATKTLVRLMQRVMTQMSIPFHGEPAIGLQVMGVLETRNLDFRHIILLSANEGKLPKNASEVSFIPYNLREAFGMNTIQRQNAVYAYYFYRMIQRAEQVTIVYNNGTDGMNKQEPSRYIMQLQVEFPGKLHPRELHSPSRPAPSEAIVVEQTNDTRHKLQEHFRYSPEKKPLFRLSPSTLNDYLDCRLRFYLKHIEGLAPPEEPNADVDVAALGTIFHKSAELAYDRLTERSHTITKADIEALLKEEHHVQGFVDEAFRTEFFHSEPDVPLHYNGTQLIVRHVIGSYLRQLLRIDHRRAPFDYIQSEKKIRQVLSIVSHGTPLDILLGGTIDRIDSKRDESGHEVTRIIDYKTGGSQKTIKSIDELFHRDKPRDGYVFQAFYYAYLMSSEYERIAPSLLFVRNTSDEAFEPHILIDKHPVEDFAPNREAFAKQLHETIEEIFNSDVPYTATTNKEACKYCKFTSLCGKKGRVS